MSTQNNNASKEHEALSIIKDDEIDLVALAKTIWNGRKTIYYSVAVCVFIGLLVAFLSKPKYEAYATLLPSEEKDMMGKLGGLGALAGMAGVDIGSMMGGPASGIPAEIYPSVVESYPFKKELVHQKFHFEAFQEPVSIYEYALLDTVESTGDKVLKYTIKLPWTIKKAIQGEKEAATIPDYGVLHLSKEELFALSFVQDLILIEVDKKTGLINVSAEAGEPVFVAQFVQKAIDLLQNYVIDYKTKQARQNLEFIQERYFEKEKEYLSAREAFFQYKDKHRNMVSERINIEYEQLKDEYEITGSIYKSLSTQLEQAKIKIKEETPVFTVIEPAKVPVDKSWPKKSIILVVSVFLGGFIGLGLIFGKLVWVSFRGN
ncbi:Wzz/FepE/Etk N-terminal domain-containing protein [Carboxylicivirga taeanensis]|uniref:Wzz/FepE/Etk N-terminal domain-containing protein n=1 Tax=Carboxylicivirga taeanensis TaxID=1416875 RepID=UPI003F6DA536